MRKLKEFFVVALVAALVAFGTTGCKDKNEHPSGEHPTQGTSVNEHPTEHPKDANATSTEHPAGEHPKGEHPK